jgi:transposase-like protein
MPAKKKRTSELPSTFEQAWDYFSDPDRCVEYVAKLRWPDGPTCPECGGTEYSYLKTRRLWKCKDCKKQYSVRVGTIFEDSPIPLRKWLMAIWEIANDRNGISSHELARKLSITQKSAWFMLHRVRLAMQTNTFEKWSEKFDGVVEVDETLIGGKARNMKLAKRRELEESGETIGPKTGKTVVMGFRQRGGDISAHVVKTTKKDELQREVRKRVKPDATVITDELGSYRGLDQHYQHMVINHAEKYVDGQVHTNGIENFWALLKRGLSGTYVSVRPFHLFRYLDEQVYRYNQRAVPDEQRVEGILKGIAGRRLTYNELTGKVHKNEPEGPKTTFLWGQPKNYPLGPF